MPKLLEAVSTATIILVAAAGSLAAALFFQHVLGLAPCVLCIWQRWAFVAAMIPAALVLPLPAHPRFRAVLLGLSGLALLVGAGIAAYHVGVEQHWWTGTPGCGVPAPAGSLEELRAQIMAAPVVRCDVVAWSLFGISMAGYNVLLSGGLGIFALATALRQR